MFGIMNSPITAPARPDLSHHWMPFTANRDFHQDPKIICRGQGVWYYGEDDRPILDASSGLFTTPAGHGRVEIADAVRDQLLTLDYSPSFTRGHPLSFRLASRIAELTPAGLDRIFFANSGSEAVETALKMCLAYHRARGDNGRTLFVSRERAYHGVNFGGVALAGMVANRRTFGPVGPNVVHMRHTWLEQNRFVMGQADHGADLAEDLLRMIALHGAENIAACIVEPVAGSTGVLVPPRGYLERLRAICSEHGILLVFDEVITGFGRLGHAFASQAFGVVPDVMTMAKAITNGAQPMGAVAASRHVHDTVVDAAPEGAVEFLHGYTFSAHPAACAASLAALDIYADERLFDRARQSAAYFLDGLAALRDLPVVTDIRGMGMLGGIDLAPLTRPGARGHDVQKRLFDSGLHLKATGDALILAPAFVMESDEIDTLLARLRAVLAEA
jgi:beta-alanine--pyruvate transaminase